MILKLIKDNGIELKLVDKPLQNQYTSPENIQYPGETWCVITEFYREGDGGIKLWFEKIKRSKPDIIYLYEISTFTGKIVNGTNENDWFTDIIYNVRYQFKKY